MPRSAPRPTPRRAAAPGSTAGRVTSTRTTWATVAGVAVAAVVLAFMVVAPAEQTSAGAATTDTAATRAVTSGPVTTGAVSTGAVTTGAVTTRTVTPQTGTAHPATTPAAARDAAVAHVATALAVAAQAVTTTAVTTTAVTTGAAAPQAATPQATAPQVTSATIRSASAASVFGAGPYRQVDSQPAKAAATLAAAGDASGAASATAIAKSPIAIWLGDWLSDKQLVTLLQTTQAAAAKTGTTPVYVTYNIPNRDCGGYSAGGLTATAYEAWTDRIATTLRGQRAVVIVEPDSLAALSGCPGEATTRYALLKHEVTAFSAAGVASYLDAGNSNWVKPADMAARLQLAGVGQARGFFSNVSNYYPLASELAYDDQVSALTGGSHYVVDTSRNGRGWLGTWCNAPGAGLGTAPTVSSGTGALDAELWVKTPGASDGTCNGGPAAGGWYASYATALVANRASTPAAKG